MQKNPPGFRYLHFFLILFKKEKEHPDTPYTGLVCVSKSTVMESQLFAPLEQKISELQEDLAHFRTLVKCMTPGLFDQEDEQKVLTKIVQIESEEKSLQTELTQKVDIYNNHVRSVESQLATRKATLEKFDQETKLFAKFPDVLGYFAEKQSKLQSQVESVKEKLSI